MFTVSPVISRPFTPKPLGGDGELHWVPMTSNDQIPCGAVIGGFEKGEVVYVARAIHDVTGTLCPGKYVPSLKLAVVGWGLRAFKKHNFEVLCGYNLSWVKTKADAVPAHAFPGGLAPETNNEVLFIGRAPIKDSLIPGKVHVCYKSCYVTYEDLEKETGNYEVLVVPDKMPKQLKYNNKIIESEDSDVEY